MKRVYVNEEWCLGCHLCEFYCAGANSGEDSLLKAFKKEGVNPLPRITVEEGGDVNFAVQCRHCPDPICVKSCITGALSVSGGVISVDETRCVGCYTCVLTCPFGCIVIDEARTPIAKCDLCTKNGINRNGEPACVKGCPNRAIVFEEKRSDEKGTVEV